MSALQDTMIRGSEMLEDADPGMAMMVKAFMNLHIVPKIQSMQSLINRLEDSGPSLDAAQLQGHSDRIAASIVACRARIVHCRGLGPDNWEDPISSREREAGLPAWRIHQNENKRLNSALYNLAKQSTRSATRIEMEEQWHRVHDLAIDPVQPVLAIEDVTESVSISEEAHIQDDQTPPEFKVPVRPEMTREEQRQFRLEGPPAPWKRQQNPNAVLTIDGRWHADGIKAKEEKDIFYDPAYHRKKRGETQCKYQWTPSGCKKGAKCPYKHTEWYHEEDSKKRKEKYQTSQLKPPWELDREDRQRHVGSSSLRWDPQIDPVRWEAMKAMPQYRQEQQGGSSSSSNWAKAKPEPKPKQWRKKQTGAYLHHEEDPFPGEEE